MAIYQIYCFRLPLTQQSKPHFRYIHTRHGRSGALHLSEPDIYRRLRLSAKLLARVSMEVTFPWSGKIRAAFSFIIEDIICLNN